MTPDRYYKSKHWLALRAARLRLDLFTCIVPGCGQPARTVDHIISRAAGGADKLENLRSLCDEHDKSVKEKANGLRSNEGRLKVKGCYPDGSPLDPAHAWYTGGPGAKGVRSP